MKPAIVKKKPTKPATIWERLGLSRRAFVFSTEMDRVIIDLAGAGKVRMILERKRNGHLHVAVFDQLRPMDLDAAMADVPPRFRRCVADALERLRAPPPAPVDDTTEDDDAPISGDRPHGDA